MFNIFACEEDKEALRSFYDERSHQDSYYELDYELQFCYTCGANRFFKYDRCEVCHSN